MNITQSFRKAEIAMADLNIVSICGSLRKGSYNAMVQRALPALAPEGMTIKAGEGPAQP